MNTKVDRYTNDNGNEVKIVRKYKYAWLPTKIKSDIIWFKKYIQICKCELKQKSSISDVPISSICTEEGYPVFGSNFKLLSPRYETCIYEEWDLFKKDLKING